MHIAFVGMVKFKFLAHFPVDHLARQVVSSLVLLLCKFAASTYYVIGGFISVTAYPTFAVLLRLIYLHLDMIGSYGVVLCCHIIIFIIIIYSLRVLHISVV